MWRSNFHLLTHKALTTEAVIPCSQTSVPTIFHNVQSAYPLKMHILFSLWEFSVRLRLFHDHSHNECPTLAINASLTCLQAMTGMPRHEFSCCIGGIDLCLSLALWFRVAR